MRLQTDYQKTGKLYAKLDAYYLQKRGPEQGQWAYYGSSNQFKTLKAYKTWLPNSLFQFKIMKVVEL